MLTTSAASEATLLLQAPTWDGRLPNQPDRDEGHFVNALEGSLEAIDADDPGSKLAWVDVMLRVRSDAIDGGVNGIVQTAKGGAFLVPQGGDDHDVDGWIGVIGDGFYGSPWATL